MFANRSCSLIGVVHLPPLPGAAFFDGDMPRIIDGALREALIYKETGFHAVMVENTHDTPYLKGGVAPETTAAVTVISQVLKKETGMPFGVQILAGANLEALGAAVASSADFIRVEGFVFAHIGDEGYHESCAPTLIRRRHYLKADGIKIFADIKKKHSSHAITQDLTISEVAKNAEYFRADGVIVTGAHTGESADLDEVKSVKATVDIPVLIGSGITCDNIRQFSAHSDALIIGSAAKFDGLWSNAVDRDRCMQIVEAQ